MFLLDLSIPCVFLALIATESNKKPSGSFQGDGQQKPTQDEKGIISEESAEVWGSGKALNWEIWVPGPGLALPTTSGK